MIRVVEHMWLSTLIGVVKHMCVPSHLIYKEVFILFYFQFFSEVLISTKEIITQPILFLYELLSPKHIKLQLYR